MKTCINQFYSSNQLCEPLCVCVCVCWLASKSMWNIDEPIITHTHTHRRCSQMRWELQVAIINANVQPVIMSWHVYTTMQVAGYEHRSNTIWDRSVLAHTPSILVSFLFWRLSIRYRSCTFHSCIFSALRLSRTISLVQAFTRVHQWLVSSSYTAHNKLIFNSTDLPSLILHCYWCHLILCPKL